MLHDNVQAAVRDIVVNKLLNRISFTSVDITQEARSQGLFARNRDVAEWLRRNLSQLSYEYSALYNSTLIEVNSERDGLTRAYLYHHMDISPATYLNRGDTSAGAKTVLHTIAAITGQTPNPSRSMSNGQHWSNRQRRDAFGRFC